MITRIYTYDSGESENLESWGMSWAAAGFEPIVLNKKHAAAHPYYQRFRYSLNVINKFIFGKAISQKAEDGWTKWLAFAGVSGSDHFFACDINLFNCDFCPDFFPKGLTFWRDDRLVSGAAINFLLFCKSVEAIDQFVFLEFVKDCKYGFDVSAVLQARKAGVCLGLEKWFFSNKFNYSNENKFIEQKKTARRSIPFFMHIPRCGGTYAFGCMSLFARYYSMTYAGSGEVLFYNIYSMGVVILRVIAIGPAGGGYRHVRMEFSDFLSAVQGVDFGFIFSIMVEPHGVKIHSEIINSIWRIGLRPVCFVSWRSSWSLANSVFEYLSSNFSKHEDTHRAVGCSLADYIKSDVFSDSWLIRNLLNLSDFDAVTSDLEDIAYQYLKKWRFCDVSKIDGLIEIVFQECYNISFNKIPPAWRAKISKNESVKVDRELEGLPLDVREVFLFKTKLNTILYEKLAG